MKKILLAIGALIVVAVGVLLAVASRQPDRYHVERSVSYAASPADVFPYVNDYGKWAEWNPWRTKDPNIKEATSDPKAGVGAWTSWEGNGEVGKGRMTILESVRNEKVVHELHFIEPFEDVGKTTFTLTPEGDHTKLTWAMDGDMNLLSKVMCLFSDMDAMIGGDAEKGLRALGPKVEADAKARIEREQVKAAAAQSADPWESVEDVPPVHAP